MALKAGVIGVRPGAGRRGARGHPRPTAGRDAARIGHCISQHAGAVILTRAWDGGSGGARRRAPARIAERRRYAHPLDPHGPVATITIGPAVALQLRSTSDTGERPAKGRPPVRAGHGGAPIILRGRAGLLQRGRPGVHPRRRAGPAISPTSAPGARPADEATARSQTDPRVHPQHHLRNPAGRRSPSSPRSTAWRRGGPRSRDLLRSRRASDRATFEWRTARRA